MPVERFYTPLSIKEGDTIEITEQEFHHLAHVIKMKKGEHAEIVNGRGVLGKGVLTNVGRRSAALEISSTKKESSKETQTILVQALPRKNRLDNIIEKVTELGIDAIWLFPGEESERQEFSPAMEKRLSLVCIGAMKQSGRLYLPEVRFLPLLKEWKIFPDHAFYGDVNPEAPLFLEQMNPSHSLYFFVGPERGFSNEEEKLLKEAGVIGVTLHRNILRTDTAAIAAATLMTHQK